MKQYRTRAPERRAIFIYAVYCLTIGRRRRDYYDNIYAGPRTVHFTTVGRNDIISKPGRERGRSLDGPVTGVPQLEYSRGLNRGRVD